MLKQFVTLSVILTLSASAGLAAITLTPVSEAFYLANGKTTQYAYGEGRAGEPDNVDHQYSVGYDTTAPGVQDKAYTALTSVPFGWTFFLDATRVTFQYTGGPIVTYNHNKGGYARDIWFRLAANGARTTVSNMTINGENVDAIPPVGDPIGGPVGDPSPQYYRYSPAVPQALTITGTTTFSWTGVPPINSEVAFALYASNPTPEPGFYGLLAAMGGLLMLRRYRAAVK